MMIWLGSGLRLAHRLTTSGKILVLLICVLASIQNQSTPDPKSSIIKNNNVFSERPLRMQFGLNRIVEELRLHHAVESWNGIHLWYAPNVLNGFDLQKTGPRKTQNRPKWALFGLCWMAVVSIVAAMV